jgi:hypothetical protein
VRSKLVIVAVSACAASCWIAGAASAGNPPIPPGVAAYTEMAPTASGSRPLPRTWNTSKRLPPATEHAIATQGGSDAAELKSLVASNSSGVHKVTTPKHRRTRAAHARLAVPSPSEASSPLRSLADSLADPRALATLVALGALLAVAAAVAVRNARA